MRKYTPVPGSVPDRAAAYLETRGDAQSNVLAEALGCKPGALVALLAAAVKGGLLIVRKDGHRNTYSFGARPVDPPEAVEPTDPEDEGPDHAPFVHRIIKAADAPRVSVPAFQWPPTGAAAAAAQPVPEDDDEAADDAPPMNDALKQYDALVAGGQLGARENLGDFACALYSDGRLVLELPEQTVTLCRPQTETLVKYLDRMAAE